MVRVACVLTLGGARLVLGFVGGRWRERHERELGEGKPVRCGGGGGGGDGGGVRLGLLAGLAAPGRARPERRAC